MSDQFRTLTLMLLFFSTNLFAQSKIDVTERFENPKSKLEKTGKGLLKIENGVLKSKDAYATFGDADMVNYEFSFRARTPENEKQVQIWSGFRALSRNDRYILGLRGGIENDLYLARLGYMGTDDHLALRHLDFQLTPGKWYDIKVQVVGSRIKVFLNKEELPWIDVQDPNMQLAAKGKVVLGGSWINTEFDDLKIKSLAADYFSGNPVKEYQVKKADKNLLREKQRAAYKPIPVKPIGQSRTKISLDGAWLFSPGYESKTADAISPSSSDQDWHVMTVPQFWNPNREWLHGERYNTASKGVSDNYYQKEIERCEGYTFDYKKTDVGYYRQWLELPENINGKYLELTFDAVSKIGEVFINGKRASDPHIGMFGEFKVNATPFLKPGKNLIVVKVSRDYVKDIKDADKVTDVAVTVPVTNKMLKDLAHGFYNDDPAGIWQPVALVISDPVRITDVYIKPKLTGADFEVTVKNNSNAAQKFTLSTAINSAKNKSALYDAVNLKDLSLNAGEEKTFSYSVQNLKPLLWTPTIPNLYNFNFILGLVGKEADRQMVVSGFRTFKARGDFFYLNDKQYWLRGGNHTPMSLAPNDTALANQFNKLLHDGNIMVTRTHTAPYNELWLSSSDQNGVGVSYEGGWPWLMIRNSMPDPKLIELWKNEFYDLIKKYRNHPALLFWTVNNEMKFYDNDPDFEQAKLKMAIISDVVKRIRQIDPTRPVCFDSNYTRNERKFGKDFFTKIDDGDIDDHHWYVNWYHGSIFNEFNGEWQKNFKNEGRPLISQEFSTGYASETGHPTRFYTYVHQNPGSLVGNYAYEFANPEYFLKAQTFITRESAEAVRRTNEKAAGILHFAALTWFKNIYLADKIAPHPSYLAMKKALQPVLVSAELWGRHFYAGAQLPARIYVVNDRDDATALAETELQWSIQDANGKTLVSGKEAIEPVAYYGRKWIAPKINIPSILPAAKINAKLVLRLLEKGKTVSENDYELLLSNQKWLGANELKGQNIVLVDKSDKATAVADYIGLTYKKSNSLIEAIQGKPGILILSGLDAANTSAAEIAQVKSFVTAGGKLLLLNSGKLAVSLFPEQVRDVLQENGEIVSIEIPESTVFDDIDPMETRYFNNNKRDNPLVMKSAYKINRDQGIEALASFVKIHGYLEGDMNERTRKLDEIKGFPIVKIKNTGTAILSEMMLEKGTTDPVAGKLFVNMLKDLSSN
ncbi:MAG: glycoside hydrolase family 2 TIM barrel-domain containing protein [Candidatus Pedobacter colombiensis]|uniref:beta-galactosidase n=1 Tax=Candidatus Pedobacter colombiensis TaxID=3121371 RepID=A0AAJ6B786_9SPHI|nr:glycoside hydrolase family 2 TIM barrel-domain containing protein [Pedobacter sp.]WEK17808.1 MAG: glycoside hydrolase family 2 TIM barrel-domain containing protein [Pedobacter sp.]